jgi:ubiquinone/menaquinone biosynthesis C-methylase UbiE
MTVTNTIRGVKKTYNIFAKTTRLHKFLYFLAFLISFSLMMNYGRKQVEGFEEKTNEYKTVNDVAEIYDDFYVDIYDQLVFCKNKNDYEIGTLVDYGKMVEGKSVVLDIGSGTGHHVSSLKAHGFDAIGIDIAPSMVKKAQQTYPDLKFQVADALIPNLFPEQSFSHITCFYFTLYYIQDKRKLFENCMRWLKPGGFFAVHMVNRDKFDPILPAGNPFTIVSPQSYAKKRIMNTTVKFDAFEYKSTFDMKETIQSNTEPNAFMRETFKNNKNGNVRQNEHRLYMNTQAEILDIAKEFGFIVDSKIDLTNCQYDSQYVYVLQKPT